jgi:hypothetical protein
MVSGEHCGRAALRDFQGTNCAVRVSLSMVISFLAKFPAGRLSASSQVKLAAISTAADMNSNRTASNKNPREAKNSRVFTSL